MAKQLNVAKALEPLWNQPVSIADLVTRHEDLFYQQTARDLTHPVFTERRLLDRVVIDQYSAAVKANRLDFARSHNLPESDIKFPLFPLHEVLAWWITYTIYHENYHGMRSYVTPTSTHIEGERLGVAFLVNECLRVSHTFVHRREVVYPPAKI